jgi:DNA invertase Pin-like site-specific DNA recombinase
MNQQFKVGLYVRVSTEEQAENPEGSIKNQEERLKEFVKLKQMVAPFGEVVEVFVDAGISAKDMNRPALQRLLQKIQSKEINLILVTELSRFTRSIKDFSILWEFLEKHQCKFMSIKDNFDTSTAAGELVMYLTGESIPEVSGVPFCILPVDF